MSSPYLHRIILVDVLLVLGKQSRPDTILRDAEGRAMSPCVSPCVSSIVRVTILVPGYVVSNLTIGKGIQKDGNIGIDEEARDVNIYLPTELQFLNAG